MAYRYEYGIGVDKNEGKSFEWYLKLAESGDINAQNRLGCHYEYGIRTGKTEIKAFEWYLESAKSENAAASSTK